MTSNGQKPPKEMKVAVVEEDINREGRSQLKSLHDFVLSTFKEDFGEKVGEVKLTPLAHECWVTVFVEEEVPGMEELAKDIEKDFQELGRTVTVFVKRPWKLALWERFKNFFGF